MLTVLFYAWLIRNESQNLHEVSIFLHLSVMEHKDCLEESRK